MLAPLALHRPPIGAPLAQGAARVSTWPLRRGLAVRAARRPPSSTIQGMLHCYLTGWSPHGEPLCVACVRPCACPMQASLRRPRAEQLHAPGGGAPPSWRRAASRRRGLAHSCPDSDTGVFSDPSCDHSRGCMCAIIADRYKSWVHLSCLNSTLTAIKKENEELHSFSHLGV